MRLLACASRSGWHHTALCGLALAVAGCGAEARRTPSTPARAMTARARSGDAARVLAPYFAGRWLLGASLAFVDARGAEFVNLGTLDGSRAAPSEDTFYEIGSLAKTFTGLLLAELVEQRYVTLDQTLESLLPSGVRMPDEAATITLLELATHHSGLPRVPPNFASADPNDPYAGYDDAHLYAYLANARLVHEPGSTYAYSNLGFGILGHVLARAAGSRYEPALELFVCAQAGLRETRASLSAAERLRLAPPHDADLAPAENWTLGALEGAGGLRSTTRDLARYAALLLGTQPSPLGPAIREQLLPRADGPNGVRMALGWHVRPDGTLTHSGLTGGYAAEMRVDRARGVAVVALTNTALNLHSKELGDALLAIARGQMPAAPALPREARDAPEALDAYVGSYPLNARVSFAVSREGTHLVVLQPGERRIVLYPDAAGGFFAKALELHVRFESDANGMFMITTQNGRDLRRPRLRASSAL